MVLLARGERKGRDDHLFRSLMRTKKRPERSALSQITAQSSTDTHEAQAEEGEQGIELVKGDWGSNYRHQRAMPMLADRR